MKPCRTLPLILLAVAPLFGLGGQTAELNDQAAIAIVRSVIKADRQAVVAEALQLTDSESQAFWPIYHQYRAEMDKVGDGLVKLIRDYATSYPDIPEDRSKKMLKEFTDLQKEHLATQTTFLKKFAKVLPTAKTLRFAQVENRLDLAMQLKLASEIPLMPVEGDFTVNAAAAAATVDGVPGGVFVQTYELTAKVASVDPVSRRVTLVSADGIKKTVKAGPDVVNFDQIRVGDQLKIEATEELVVQMAPPADAPTHGVVAFVALAPKGAKPGAISAETTRVTATVSAINAAKRTATLRLDDGSTRTFPVRGDVDLSQRKVGEKVVFLATETVAITVRKP